jgi:hypothetical protein
MKFSATNSKRASRGWWRLVSGILFISVVTLAIGFYLPLRESQRLLTRELVSVRGSVAQLTESLKRSETALKEVSAERGELRGFKAQVASEAERFPKLVEQFAGNAEGGLAPAFEKKQLVATALSDGLGIDWMNPALLNWKRTLPTAAGQRLLCPTMGSAKRVGLGELTIRTFVDSEAVSAGPNEAYAAATALAITFGEQLARMCRVAPGTVTVATSPGTKASPLVRFEFRQPQSAGSVGL